MMKRLPNVLVPLLAAALGMGAPAAAQAPDPDPAPRGSGIDTDEEDLPTDSTDLRERAEEIQADFERFREARIPPSVARGGTCDERIGRFCLRHDGDDAPLPQEPPEVGMARNRILRDLGRIAERIPGDPWVFAQRVFYLGESGNLRGAESLARRCSGPQAWWCDALLGRVLHQGGRFVAADSAFTAALASMPPDVRDWYGSPDYILDTDGRERFDSAEPGERADLWRRLWLLSDPLFLVEGNDRLTSHLARKTLVRIRAGTLTAYGLPFDDDRDLEELNVRYGGERGYERVRSPTRLPGLGAGLQDTRQVVGRHHPRDREYLPTGSFLEDPAEIPPGAWTLDEAEPRTGYAAPYALDVRPLEAQVARFRRGDSLLVVASWRPASPPGAAVSGGPGSGSDAAQAEPDRPSDRPTNPFLRPGRGDPDGGGDADGVDGDGGFGLPERAGDGGGSPGGGGSGAGGGPEGAVESGFFLLEWDGTPAHESRGQAEEGVAAVRVPDGAYVLGLEVWEETAGRAWRVRQGLRQETLFPGQLAVSDLLFLRSGGEAPRSVEEALPRTLPAIRIGAGDSFTVAWEVYGLRPGESGRVTLGFTRGEPGLLQRIGEYLRLVEPDAPVEISFDERAPDRPGAAFRALDVDVPSFEPGVYTLHLEVELPGRTPVVTSRRLTVE